MENHVLFNSKRYKKITWSALFNSAAIAASPDKKPFAISNNYGFVMSGNFAAAKNTIRVCQSDNSLADIHVKKLNSINCSLQNNDVLAFQMLTGKTNQCSISNIYMNFHNQLLYRLYKACKSIMIYTYDHLGSRYYDNKSIAKIETVESNFSEIIILMNQVSPFILKLQSIDEVNHLLSLFLIILKTLSQLCGARAVLSGNVLDLAFKVRLFQRFIAE